MATPQFNSRRWSSAALVTAAGALLALAALLGGAARGQSPSASGAAASVVGQATPDARPLAIDRGAAGVWQALLKLHTRASLLMVVAHPDDEDGGMLAYETRGHGVRAAQMTLNRLTPV